ncbi:MAG: bifunctional UDP-N-acetylglucosamine diphosphorylase/glucosamine-1-phosphate N-acetyltransferase GlmU [Chloroflexi bacterium]|nr:bifunctional UDP-N-acetylglucosamine diphosphorylase/glucosamine-1-phosphate N-acetyltransferase GlmU [Chloroflexota bacterium]
MRSLIPKLLHSLAGQPLLRYPLAALQGAGVKRRIVVRDPSPALPEALGDPDLEYVVQDVFLGTGGALRHLLPTFQGQADSLLVVNGDVPFVSPSSLRALVAHHGQSGAALTLLTALAPPPGASSGLGRIARDASGLVSAIVEAHEDDRRSGEGPAEFNCGAYCLDAVWLWPALARLTPHAGGELYLTDLVYLASQDSRRVEAVPTQDRWESVGINTRVDLALAEQEMRRRTLERLMLDGVTITDPSTTYIDASVRIGIDTVIYPSTHVSGASEIGAGCHIGPGAIVRDSRIGDGCHIVASLIEGASLEEEVDVGPYSHLRPGAYLCRGVHIGNFAEVKASRLGREVKMGHFSYVGDADIGDRVNIGAGVVTCNFDGVQKHRTVVEEDAFVGSDTMLVAPVRVGARSKTGAGSVVTKDVPPESVAAGMPARVSPRSRSPKS